MVLRTFQGARLLLVLALGCSSEGADSAVAASSGASPPSGSVAAPPAATGGTTPAPAPASSAAPSSTASGCEGMSGTAPGNSIVSLSHGGTTRTSRLHVPPSYDPKKPAMLVLNFHGLMETAALQESITKRIASSDKHGFVVAHPEGISQSWNTGMCCGGAAQNKVDDVGFVKSLLSELQSKVCVDKKRIYATGMSNGGHMSYRLACQMSDVFAAVAPVAGQLLEPTCVPVRPIPILEIHGTSDTIVSYTGGAYRSTEASLGVFRKQYGCGSQAPSTTSSKGDTTCVTYPGCSAEVSHCKVDGGGHTWPGGLPMVFLGKTSTDLDATEAIAAFFEKNPMP